MGPTPCLLRGDGGAAVLVQEPWEDLVRQPPSAAHPLPSSFWCGAVVGSFQADPQHPGPRAHALSPPPQEVRSA